MEYILSIYIKLSVFDFLLIYYINIITNNNNKFNYKKYNLLIF